MRLAIWYHHHKFWEISKAETGSLFSVEFFHLKLPVKKKNLTLLNWSCKDFWESGKKGNILRN